MTDAQRDRHIESANHRLDAFNGQPRATPEHIPFPHHRTCADVFRKLGA